MVRLQNTYSGWITLCGLGKFNRQGSGAGADSPTKDKKQTSL